VDEGDVKHEALSPCQNLVNYKKLVPKVVEEQGRFHGMPILSTRNYRIAGGTSCLIYENRPSCCSAYRCAWINGEGDEEDRPDKCGVVVDEISRTGPIRNALIAKPLWFGAEDEEAGGRAMERISRSSGVPLLVLQFTEFRLLRIVGRGVA